MRQYLTDRRLERLAYYIKSRANVTDTIPTNLTENLSILYTGNETTVGTFTFKPGFIYQYKDSEWHEVPVIADDEVAREDAQEALSRTASDIEYSGDVSGATNIAEALDILAQGSTDLGAAVQVVNSIPQNPDDDVAILYNGETGQGFTKGHIYQYNSNAWTEIEIVDGVAREAAGTASTQAQEALEGLNGKADKVNSATSGNFAGLDGNGNLVDSGKSADDFLSADTPLPEQVQSDWDETDDTKLDYIRNKPSIPPAQVNSDWNSSSGVSEILNKPTLGTAASKNSTSTVSENNTNLVESGAVKEAIDAAIASVYKPAGNKTVAELTGALLITGNLGNVYNMTTSGITTSDFVEGQGKDIEIGDNVAIVDIGTQGSPIYKFDLLSGMVDLTNYVQKSNTVGLLKNDGNVDTTAYAKQSEMSVTPGTGTDSDKTTIQLKTGTSATVLTQHIPAGTSTPVMDGTGSAGSSTNYAREDHVHPSDTSKQDVLTFDSVPTENSTNPVESGGIYTELQGKADTEDLTIPTDAVLHYSFDEVPDYPDGTADVRLLNNNTYDIQSGNFEMNNNGGTTISNANGDLQLEINSTTTTNGIYMNYSYTQNKILKFRFKISNLTEGANVNIRNGTSTKVAIYNKNGDYEIAFISKNTQPSNNSVFIFLDGSQVSASVTILFEAIYIGDGSYSTPIIDNSNGKNNATNNGGIAVSGVSGKGAYFLNGKYANIGTDSQLNANFSVSLWVNPDNNTQGLNGTLINFVNQFSLRNGYAVNKLEVTLYDNNGNLLISNGIARDLLTANKWSHIVVTRDGVYLRVFVDGIRVITFILSNSTIGKATNAYLSSSYSSRPQSYDDLLIFNRALSDTEVNALYLNKANTPKYYDLNNYRIDNADTTPTQNSTNLIQSGGVFTALQSKVNTSDIASSVQSGNTNPVSSGAVADILAIPTDAVLHYSFDDVPDLPDGTADVKKEYGSTYNDYTSYCTRNIGTETISNNNGNLHCVSNTTDGGVGIKTALLSNKICVVKVKVIKNQCRIGQYTNVKGVGTWTVVLFNASNFYIISRNSEETEWELEQIYIGDGSYSTPIIDNANGQNNATNNGGIAVQGVSGKGAYFLNGKYANIDNYNLTDNFSISVWVKPDNITNNLRGDIFQKIDVFALRNGSISDNKLMVTLVGRNGNLLNSEVLTDLLPQKEWANIIITKNEVTFKAYMNGELVKTKTLSDTAIANNSNSFNVSNQNNTRPQSIDDLIIFDRALSETEVLALYQNKANTPKYVTASPMVLDNNNSVSGKAVIDYVNASITQVINTAY